MAVFLACLRVFRKRPRSYSDDHTLSLLTSKKKLSIVRYGNSELSFLLGRSIKHQDFDWSLWWALAKILLLPPPSSNRLLICLPLRFTRHRYKHIWSTRSRVWRWSVILAIYAYASSRYVYGSAHLFRLTDVATPNLNSYSKMIETYLSHQNIIFVGPSSGRNAQIPLSLKITHRINIPEKNAFSQIKTIKGEIYSALHPNPDATILIVAGLTATVLASELSSEGFHAIDFGQYTRHLQYVQGNL